MKNNAWKVRQKAEDAWSKAVYHLKQIRQSSDVRPTPPEIFKVATDVGNQIIELSIGPVVFRVNERPSKSAANLFIVVEGWISFDNQSGTLASFQANGFGTKVAYFRYKKNRFEHIFGAHYDLERSDYRHPVFHAQLNSYTKSIEHVRQLYFQDCELDDHMSSVLRNVRIPTAQMDVFSVIVQICADHLIDDQSSPSTTSAFEEMKRVTSFLIGAGNSIECLNNPHAASCYRAAHWYNT